MLPRVTDIGENGGQWHDLRLIGQVKNSVDVKHVEKLRGLHKTAFHLTFVLFVRRKGQVQERLPITGYCR